MDAFVPTIPQPRAYRLPRSDRLVATLLFALLWLTAAVFAGIAAGFLAGFATGFHNGLLRAGPPWRLSPLVYVLASAAAMQATLLGAVWRRAAVTGRGDRRAGSGNLRIRRPGLLVGLAAVEVVIVPGWALLMVRWQGHVSPTFLARQATLAVDPLIAFLLLLVVGLLAPLAEELFFRGWLWTALRRYWGTLPVMAATSLPWLLLHALDGGLRRLVFLLPATILLNVARQGCASVRASVVLHMMNNVLALGWIAAAIAGAHSGV